MNGSLNKNVCKLDSGKTNRCAILFHAYREFVKEIWQDIMFAALFFVPILMSMLFHFAIPLLEEELCEMQHVTQIIEPYYICFDLCIIMMTPIMFSFSGVMVILEELDNGLAHYLMVTPLGKSGYLWSRIGFMSVIAMTYASVITYIFRLSNISPGNIVVSSIIAAFVGALISFFVLAFAHNKVEGMALTKFSAFFVLGIPISIFIKEPFKYVGFFLPSFWATEYCVSSRLSDLLLGLGVGILLLCYGYHCFERKI